MGRPALPLSSNFHDVDNLYLVNEITSSEASKILNMNSGTFYRNLRLFQAIINC